MATRDKGATAKKKPAASKSGKGAGKTTRRPALKALAGKKRPPTNAEAMGISGMLGVSAKDEEAFEFWSKRIEGQNRTLDKALKAAREERSKLGELFKSAGESGLPKVRLSVLKTLMKMELRDKLRVVEEHRELAWQMGVKKSEFMQLGLFEVTKEPSLEQWELMGTKAGKEGQPIDNAPGKPGEDRHTRWVNGWKAGQKELAEETFGQDGDGDGDNERLVK